MRDRLDQELSTFNPQLQEFYKRLYSAHLQFISAFHKNHYASKAYQFFQQLFKSPELRKEFPPDHPRTIHLQDFFIDVLQEYVQIRGRPAVDYVIGLHYLALPVICGLYRASGSEIWKRNITISPTNGGTHFEG